MTQAQGQRTIVHVNRQPFDSSNRDAHHRKRGSSARKKHHYLAEFSQAGSYGAHAAENSWRGSRRRHNQNNEEVPAGRHRREDAAAHTRPTEQQFRRRRIAATTFAAFLLVCAAGVGVTVQKLTHATHKDPQAHNTVKEPADYAPTEAVAIPPTSQNVQVTPAVARIPKKFRPIHDVMKPGQNKTLLVNSQQP